MSAWELVVDRDDLTRAAVVDGLPVPDPAEGQAVLRVDRVGLTANNVTYAVLGESFRYWEFFPAGPGRGIVPLWGFAEVVASRADGVEEGTRVYGYLPSGSHLLVTPGRSDARGFRDQSPHRTDLPSPYNAYATTTGDPAYEPDGEDLQVLFRPLFFTSFVLADQLEDTGFSGASTVVLSSASSKTAYGTAFLLRGTGPRVVGLTSRGNVGFTKALDCYDAVVSYDDVEQLEQVPTAYIDVAGSGELRQRLHDHLQQQLLLDLVVGVTHQESGRAGTLRGARPSTFFAPDQMRKRTGDWGREGLDQRFADAWRRFAPVVDGWVDVTVGQGPQALRDAWLEVLSGRSDPRTGHVLQL